MCVESVTVSELGGSSEVCSDKLSFQLISASLVVAARINRLVINGLYNTACNILPQFRETLSSELDQADGEGNKERCQNGNEGLSVA